MAPPQPNVLSRVYNCKVLACPDAVRVVVISLRSPVRDPDPKALEKFAKVDLPKAIRAQSAAQGVLSDGTTKIETLSSTTAQLKNRPGVLNDTKYTTGKKVVFFCTAFIFTGPTILKFIASSPDRELAQKSLAGFIEASVITDGPPLPVTSGVQPIPAVPVRPTPRANPTQSL
jgi:hypothetical protein